MQERHRLGVLDGLRGLMSLWVVIGHTCGATGMFVLPILRSPHYAVDGFMLLSGFLMTFHYTLRAEREPWTSPKTWMVFYVRRYFRISPLYYLCLLPAYLFISPFTQWRETLHNAVPRNQPLAEMPPLSVENVLAHITYLFGLWPKYHSSMVIPDWSLSLEMQFYLVFPFLMLFALRFGWIAFAAVASGLYLIAKSSAMATAFIQPSPLPLSLVWFVIGMVWATAYIGIQEGRKRQLPLLLFAACLSLLSKDPHDIFLVAIFCWLLFATSRNAGGHWAESMRNALSGRVASFLGDASYSVYLIHLFILMPTACYLYTHTQLGSVPRFAIVLAVTLAISYALAKPLESIESLGISWGKKLSRSISASSPMKSTLPASEAGVSKV